jgi:hypothetical protein
MNERTVARTIPCSLLSEKSMTATPPSPALGHDSTEARLGRCVTIRDMDSPDDIPLPLAGFRVPDPKAGQ